jgi:hypothetical protein
VETATATSDGRRDWLRSERRGSDSGGRDGGCRGSGVWSEAVGERAGAERRAVGERRARGDGRRGSACGAAVGRGAVDVTRGSHAAVARYHAGPARRATADKRGPLVSDFRIKIYPEGN